jgi:asparagine synthase (glutamine-hydrolysing)
VVFASEMKAIVSAYGSELHMDPASLVASVLYSWVPDDRCAVSGLQKVPPASWVEVRPDGSRTTRRYWDVAEVAAAAAEGPAIGSALAEVVEASVAAHLVADTPVSAFLSGGLDSSIVTVLAKRANPELDAYTITFRPEDRRLEAMPDDAVFARRVAALHGIRLHEIAIAPDVANLLPRMVEVLDEPVGDAAAINTLLMCEAARDAGVKVILSGMGADEIFGGYRKYIACKVAARYRRLPAFARRAASGAVGLAPVAVRGRGIRTARWAKRFLTFSELPEEAAFRRSYSLYDPDELESLLSADVAPYMGELVQEHADIYEDNRLADHADRMCLADSRYFLPGLNLAYTDRASMAVSTEVRVPFVDDAVFEAAFSLRGAGKVNGRHGKVALKRIARSWLPDEIVSRPKVSFSAPLRAWVSRDLRQFVDDVLCDGELAGSGFLQRDGFRTLVAEDRAGREDRSRQVWQLLTLELWYRWARAAGVGIGGL